MHINKALLALAMGVALAACRDPIPEGVFYSKEHDNFFRDSDRSGMGTEFYNTWKSRAGEFPQAGQMDPEQ